MPGKAIKYDPEQKNNVLPKFKTMKTKFTVLSMVFTALLFIGQAAWGQGCPNPEPQVVPDNPNCCSLGGGYAGYKINQSPNGTFCLDDYVNGEITCNPMVFTGGAGRCVTISNSDGYTFDWSSNFPISRMIVKGGPDANVYYYDPPAYCGTGLHAPYNPGSGQYYGLSHIEWCFNPAYLLDATVGKDATTEWTRTYTWEIDKSVSPDSWDLFTGDQATSMFTVEVDQTVTDGPYEVSGSITVANLENTPVTLYGISDVITGYGDPIPVTPSCGVTFPYVLAAQSELTCTYTATVPTGTGGTNTATVYFSSDLSVFLTAAASITFSADPTTVVGYPTVNVEDSNGGSWTFSGDGSASYTESFACDADEGTYNNTATILETGQSDDASVTVNCYELTVTKDATTSFTRTYDWTIDKVGDVAELVLSTGQVYDVCYDVTLDATYTDSDWGVSGSIIVSNPAPIPATINSIADVVLPDIAATCDCEVTFPYELEAGETLECTYEADLPDATPRTNTATATLQNYSYDYEGEATESGTTGFTGTADVIFGDPTEEIDECIYVADDQYGDLGEVCFDDILPYVFEYCLTVGPYEECGDYTFVNVASFETNDVGVTGSDSWTVDINVPCEGGCTLTPGYWKTHSGYGPAPYDDNWANLMPDGEDSPFFLSGQTYYEVLWTSPAGGNVYYILAHAYIAAQLNFLNGASSTTEVNDAFNASTVLFNTYTPLNVPKNKKALFIGYAYTLDQYNNGYIGPGHCSEEEASAPQSAPASGSGPANASGMLGIYPNPTSNTATFVIDLPAGSQVEMTLYSPVGQKVATVYSGTLIKGQHTIQYNAPALLPNGIYIVTLVANGERAVSRLSLMR
jgi:hypothetical protein